MSFKYLLKFSKPCSKFNASTFSRDLKNIYQLSFMRFCSISRHIVQMRGLDYEAKEGDVIDFFKPLGITPKAVYLKCDASGRTSAVSEVEFSTHAEAIVAMRKKNAFMGNRFIRLTLKSSDTKDSRQANVDKDEDKSSKPTGDLNISQQLQRSPLQSGHTVKMKNAPWRLTDQAIFEFFSLVGATPISVKPIYNESGLRTGEFDIQFLTEEDAYKALVKNNGYIGKKYIELSMGKS